MITIELDKNSKENTIFAPINDFSEFSHEMETLFSNSNFFKVIQAEIIDNVFEVRLKLLETDKY